MNQMPIFNKVVLHQNGKDEAEIFCSHDGKEWRFVIDNFPGQRLFYQTNLPYTDYETFRNDLERIGINLRYISDEENE